MEKKDWLRSRIIFILVMCLPICLASTVSGGDGYVVSGTPNTLHLNLYYNYDETDMDSFQNAFNESSMLMYNAMDGQMQFGTIRVSKNSAFEDKADFWVLSGSGGANAGGFGILGNSGAHVTIYRETHRFTAEDGPGGNERGQFGIVHELGHHAFDLRNEYHGGPPFYPSGRYCISETSDVACIMDGGTTVHPTHHRTEWCTDPADGLTTAHVTAPVNHQEYEHGEACWETIVDYCSSEYGITLSEPTAVNTALPTGHVEPAWIVIGDQLRYVICVDKSYSMVGDKMNKTKIGADLFVNLVHEGESEYIAVTSFSGGAAYDPPADVDFSLTEVINDTVKDDARDAIDLINVESMTAIGDGMRASLDELETLAQDDASVEVIILLSDGVHNYGSEDPEDVIPDLRDRGVRVFTIGLGDPAHPTYPLDEDTLQDIAYETGGLYTHAPTEADLATIYTAYCAEVRGAEVCAEDMGDVPPGGGEEQEALIDEFTSKEEATFVLHWPVGKGVFDLQLLMPDGTIIDPAVAATDPNIKYVEKDYYEFYRIKQPMKGTWKLKIIAAAEDSYVVKEMHGEMTAITVPKRFPYTTQVLAEARGVDFTAFSKKVQFKYPQVPIIQASVAAGPPVAGALVTGVITRPDGTKVNITLYDDGDFSHGDVRSDDGIYSNRFLEFSKDGSYKIHLTVNNIEGVEATPDEPVPPEWKPKPIPPFNRVSKTTIIVRGLPETFPAPEIKSITPSEGKQGETLDITITGSDFAGNAVINFIGDGITIHKATFVSPEKITASISIDQTANPGARDIKVTNPGGQSDTAEGIFSVKEGGVTPPVCGNGTCDANENFKNCPEDCPSGGKDGYCDGVKDGKCDPDCLKGIDPDCECKIPWWLVILIIILILILILVLWKKPGHWQWVAIGIIILIIILLILLFMLWRIYSCS